MMIGASQVWVLGPILFTEIVAIIGCVIESRAKGFCKYADGTLLCTVLVASPNIYLHLLDR